MERQYRFVGGSALARQASMPRNAMTNNPATKATDLIWLKGGSSFQVSLLYSPRDVHLLDLDNDH